MELISDFALEQHAGPYESWGLSSRLLRNGVATDVLLPGYVLEAQYRHSRGFLFLTSWDCPFEEALDIVTTAADLKILGRKRIGAPYASYWLESHEVLNERQVLLQSKGSPEFRVTVFPRLILEARDNPGENFKLAFGNGTPIPLLWRLHALRQRFAGG
ncbi:MAG: hypothetical protein FWF20_01550 [Betaproteobacteria bacterium]|nr:hypothetical protein [Betaproteobacteria bacterium]MCL2885467.1 hypothetical protein [Betaproteobacteria bacterium]